MSENKLLVLKNSQEATNYYGTKYSVFLPWFFALLIKGKAQKSLFMLLCNIAGIWLENKGKGHYLGNTQSPIDERPIAQIEMLEQEYSVQLLLYSGVTVEAIQPFKTKAVLLHAQSDAWKRNMKKCIL